MADDQAQTTRGGARPGAGRRPVEQRLERVSTRLPVQQFDQLVKLANQRDVSVSGLVRQLIIMRLG